MKRFFSNYSYGDNEPSRWSKERKALNNTKPSKVNCVLYKFRACSDSKQRFEFVNMLTDYEREILIHSMNDNEFNCFIKILSNIEIKDYSFKSVDLLNEIYLSSNYYKSIKENRNRMIKESLSSLGL